MQQNKTSKALLIYVLIVYILQIHCDKFLTEKLIVEIPVTKYNNSSDTNNTSGKFIIDAPGLPCPTKCQVKDGFGQCKEDFLCTLDIRRRRSRRVMKASRRILPCHDLWNIWVKLFGSKYNEAIQCL